MSNNNNNNNKYLTSRTYSIGFQSPEVSPYSEHVGGRPAGLGAPKAWCSERVPLSSYKARRHVAASALMPFTSGRTLPSKWDDAERWISSPVSASNVTCNNYTNFHHHHGGGGFARTSSHLVHHNHNSYYSQRRAKSKSGPLGPTGLLSYGSLNSYSPVLGMGVIHGGQWRNSVTIDSPADMGPAQFEDDLVGNCDQGSRKSCPGDPDWLDLWSGPLVHTHQELENENPNNEDVETHNQSCNDEVGVDRIISRGDMSTQIMFGAGEMMSSTPCSTVSSPKSMMSTRSYSPHDPQLDDEVCENANQSPESQVKDVQVDEHIIISTTPLSNLDKDYNYNDSPSNSTASITHTKFSKQEREEVRIRAWEDLQKAKAEAAIQKLEVELEKKRSSSMEKIAEKLKKVEIKAEKMRSSVCKGDDGQIQRHTTRSFSKLPSFCKKLGLGCYPF